MFITRHVHIISTVIIGAMVALSQADRPEPATNPLNKDILGTSFTQVMKELGVPGRIDADNHGGMTLYFSQCDASLSKPTIRLNGKTVIWVSPEANLQFKRIGVPRTGAYLGQSVKELVTRLGQGTEFYQGSYSTQVNYKSGLRVSLNDGVVVGIMKGS